MCSKQGFYGILMQISEPLKVWKHEWKWGLLVFRQEHDSAVQAVHAAVVARLIRRSNAG
jgi:hypothetical protein